MAQTPGKFFLSASTELAHTDCEDGPWAGVGMASVEATGGVSPGQGQPELPLCPVRINIHTKSQVRILFDLTIWSVGEQTILDYFFSP